MVVTTGPQPFDIGSGLERYEQYVLKGQPLGGFSNFNF
jgi:hypothetical protein